MWFFKSLKVNQDPDPKDTRCKDRNMFFKNPGKAGRPGL